MILLFCINALSYSQHGKRLDQEKITRIVDICVVAFKKHYIYPDRVVEVENYVKNKLEKGQYSNIFNLTELTKQIKKDFRHILNDRHIWIDVMENLLVADTDVSREEIIQEKKKNNFGFIKFELLRGNVGYLRLDGFNDLGYARETATHAMGMLAHSEAVILDLRYNHGGHKNMNHFISSYFFTEKTQLNSLYFRETDTLEEAWTDPSIPGKKLLKQKLYILTSQNTTSGGESFAYLMQSYKRATIIGERTRGAAHWKECFKFPDAGIFLEIPVARPINPITKKGWEGEGVRPDIDISEKDALDKAYKLALENK